jgi:hypothetical protein
MRIDFDINKLPVAEFELIEPGTYKAMITSGELKTSRSDETNAYWNFKFIILDGKYKDRCLYDNLNMYRGNNPQLPIDQHRQQNERDHVVIGIAARRWLEYLEATGFNKDSIITQTEELYNRPVLISVGIESPRTNSSFGDQNRIIKVMKIKQPSSTFDDTVSRRKVMYTTSSQENMYTPSGSTNPPKQQPPTNFPWERK